MWSRLDDGETKCLQGLRVAAGVGLLREEEACRRQGKKASITALAKTLLFTLAVEERVAVGERELTKRESDPNKRTNRRNAEAGKRRKEKGKSQREGGRSQILLREGSHQNKPSTRTHGMGRGPFDPKVSSHHSMASDY